MSHRTRTVLGVGGWFAVAAGAVTAGIVAVGAIGSGIAGSTTSPLSNQAVASALSRTPSEPVRTPTATTPAPTRTSPSPGTTRVLAIPGGTVMARCTGGEVTLTSWSPAQGFRTDDVDRGPAISVRLKFKSDRTEVESHISCRQGIPTAQTVSTDDRGKNRH